MAAGIFLAAGAVSAETSGDETRNLTDQTMEKKGTGVVLEVFPDQTEMQQKMMATSGEVVKKETAERNRRIEIVKSILNRETCSEGNSNFPNC